MRARRSQRDRVTLTHEVLYSLHCGNHITGHIIDSIQSNSVTVNLILADLVQKQLVRQERKNMITLSGRGNRRLSDNPRVRMSYSYSLTEKGMEVAEHIKQVKLILGKIGTQKLASVIVTE